MFRDIYDIMDDKYIRHIHEKYILSNECVKMLGEIHWYLLRAKQIARGKWSGDEIHWWVFYQDEDVTELKKKTSVILEKVQILKENIEEFLNNMDMEEETLYEDAEAYVKSINLYSAEDVTRVIDEAKEGNIILLNIGELSRRNILKLKEYLSKIKDEINAIDGDLARITPEKILVTPSKVKIIKRKSN